MPQSQNQYCISDRRSQHQKPETTGCHDNTAKEMRVIIGTVSVDWPF